MRKMDQPLQDPKGKQGRALWSRGNQSSWASWGPGRCSQQAGEPARLDQESSAHARGFHIIVKGTESHGGCVPGNNRPDFTT